MNWQFEDTGFRPGTFNMEYDEALAAWVMQGFAAPTVRVYGWDPNAISLGWSQPADEIDLTKAAKEGVDVVRRPTGGRAIFHSDEVTYSVVMPSDGKRVMSVYDDISRALVCGLRKLGVDAMIEKRQPHFPSEYRKPSSAACFTSAARYEIQVNGKKLVGSAQRRYSMGNGEEIVLQHGSILLSGDHQRIVDFLNASEVEKNYIQSELRKKTIDLSSVLGRRVEFDEVVESLKQGFEEAWSITFDKTPEPILVLR